MNQKIRMPRKVAKRILDRCSRGEPFVVVPRDGMPSKCYGLDEYEKMRSHPLKHEPWKRRRAAANRSDPLGAIDGSVLSTIARKDIYE
jgi:hypothetical protein